jgi:hypothetical protein
MPQHLHPEIAERIASLASSAELEANDRLG